MSGAESAAVIGIIASVITLVDFTTETLNRFRDFKEKHDAVPKAFRDLDSRLPLIGATLSKISARAAAGEVDEITCKKLRTVVEGCRAKLTELKHIFEKLIPRDDAGKLKVFWSAWRSQSQDKAVERIANAIGQDLQALTSYYAVDIGLTEVEKAQNKAATSDLPAPKMYILSLDGGGVRGLSILLILEHLMAKVNQGRTVPLRPCQLFDLIAGTGTGGLIAIMLGRLQMDIDECIDAYESAIKIIFEKQDTQTPQDFDPASGKALLDSKALYNAMKQILRGQNIAEEELFGSGSRQCRTFVCAAAMETKKIVLLRDYTVDGAVKLRPPPTVVDVACATMSSSLFFEPVKLGGARRYAGGDLGANNPINQVELEALNLWKMDSGFQPQCLVSIGAGNPGNSQIETDFWYLLANTMREIATETEGTASTFALRFQHLMKSDNKSYFRFNVEQGLQQFAMLECDEEQIALIQATTEGYMDNAVQKIEIEQCAALLQLRELLPLEEKPNHFENSQLVSLCSPQNKRRFWLSRLSLFILATATITCMLATTIFSWNSPAVVPDIPIIAVMGKTGAGKSSFIDALGGRCAITGKRPDIGHGLGSSTRNLTWYTISLNKRRFYLIDTPGFDDSGHDGTTLTDHEVMRMIAAELTVFYEAGRLLSGLLFLHDISQARLGGSSVQNLKMFEQLCGPDAFSRVILVTTMWINDASPARRNVQELRQQELQDRYWTSMVNRGSSVEKYDNTAKSARRILLKVADKASPVVLQVQREIVDDKLGWNETGIGRLANEAILELQVKMGNDIEFLNGALEAIRESERLRREELERQLEASREKVRDASNREKVQQAKWEEDKKRMVAAIAKREEEEEGELTEQIKKVQKRMEDLDEERKSQESKWEKELQVVKKKRIPLQEVEEGHVIVAIAPYLVYSLWIFLLLAICGCFDIPATN